MSKDNEKFASKGRFLFGEPPGLFQRFEPIEASAGSLLTPLLAFKSNLNSAILVGNIPHQLSERSEFDQHYGRILTAERIRARIVSVENSSDSQEDEEKRAVASARQRIKDDLANPVHIDRLAKQILRRLDQHLLDASFQASADELLRHLLVICWSAFEILSNDVLRVVLNERPAIVKALIEHKPYRDVLSSRTLVEALEDHSFDLSKSMGDVFCEAIRLDSLEKIQEAARLIITDGGLDATLKDDRLWRLSQQRHLIVHRRGIVDARYLSRTSEKAAIGEHIKFDAEYIESSLQFVGDTGCALLLAAERRLTSGVDKGNVDA